jgi:SAM-dependent methyltransferase
MLLPKEIVEHYTEGNEKDRLTSAFGWLERVRTWDIVRRFIPGAPATLLDIGGAAGIYALPLAAAGYEVQLLDAVPLHVEQARRASEDQVRTGIRGLASAQVGDARQLPYADESADATLLFGPLYHLVEPRDRALALREAHRVLRPGGVCLAVGISRFASILDGLGRGLVKDAIFRKLVERDLASGQHRNDTGNPDYFTTAYLHRPEELAEELVGAGFRGEALIGIEGPVWNPAHQEEEVLLDSLRAIESEPALIGASAHLMAVGRKLSQNPSADPARGNARRGA